MRSPGIYFLYILFSFALSLETSAQAKKYTHADTLKGTYSKQRSWWDVLHYDLHVSFNATDSSVKGYNRIDYKVLEPYGVLQLDLMEPMSIDSVIEGKSRCYWIRDGNSWFVSLHKEQMRGEINNITVFFHGKPHVAVMPPWDGGVIWSKDPKGNPWISIACQGMAAQVWFPNKDHMLDEADSCDLYVTCPKNLITVSNGRLKSIDMNDQGSVFHWKTVSPINNYNIIPYIGKYVNFKDTLQGENGPLDLDFWVLEDNFGKAKKQFQQVKPMIHC
ncbi:MAG: M1 family peptidase, partial [Bacteroidia bacterium]|nr:M1 family peptidase [Bacteroidia bacterium]